MSDQSPGPPGPFRYEGFASPAVTGVPDELFDVLAPELTDAELRVLLYIVRRTFGFKRESDDISLRQMAEGITTRDGRVLDRGAGVSRATVARALRGLQAKGVIVARRNRSGARGNEPTTYALRFRDDPCLTGETRGVSAVRQGVVSPVRQGLSHGRDTQETVKQETGDQDDSKIRKAPPLVDEADEGPPSHQLPARGVPAPIGAHLDELRARLEERVNRSIRPTPAATHPRPPECATAVQVPARSQTGDADAPRDQPRRTGDRAERPARRRQGRAPDEHDPDRELIAAYLADFADQLKDLAPLSASVTRAYRLYRAAGVDIDAFTRALYQARSITREHQASIRARQPGADRSAPKPRMGYFFAVLEDVLSLRGEPSTSTP